MRANSVSWYYGVAVVMAMLASSTGALGDIPVGFNGGFERPLGVVGDLPDDWEPFASDRRSLGLVTNVQRSGAQALQLSAQGREGAHLGVYQNLRVEGKRRYIFQAHVINSREAPLNGNVYGMLGIEFRDAAGKEISRAISPQWNRYLSKMKWQRFEVEAKAPKEAAFAHFAIYLLDGEDGPSKGVILIDDVEITRK